MADKAESSNNNKPSARHPRLLSHRAIAYGVLIEVSGTILVSIGMSIVTRQVLGSRGMDEEQIKAFFQSQFDNIPFMLAGLIPGFVVAACAGYVTAKTAEQLEYWHALIVVLAVALIFYGPTLTHAPVWFSTVSLLGIGAAALAGARWSKQHKQQFG